MNAPAPTELLKQPQYIIEGIILRRLHQKRIEGYTIETAKEIAAALRQAASVSQPDEVQSESPGHWQARPPHSDWRMIAPEHVDDYRAKDWEVRRSPGVAQAQTGCDTDHVDWDALAEKRLGQSPAEHGRHIPQTSPAPGCDSGSHSAQAALDPCPYDYVGGCELETAEIGPCLCANPVAQDVQSREAVAWQWRAYIGGRWGAWLDLEQPLERFKARNAYNLDNGTYELRPLYAGPAHPSADRKSGFFAQLTPEQQKAALEYDGPENHGDPAFARPLAQRVTSPSAPDALAPAPRPHE